jgi:phospholipase C
VDPDAENFALNVSNSTSPTPNPARPFAELTYLTPCFSESDHPGTGIDNGPQWLAWILNTIGNSAYWQNTAVVVTWDDWGGFYDNFAPSPWPTHPPPPNAYGNAADPNEWGFRVPLIVISPYVTHRGYVSSNLISQGAILNLIEQTFGLGTNVLNGDDYNNKSNDLSDMFNLTNTPLPWVDLPTLFSPAPVGACPSPSQL